jgi:inhibitor of KinA
VPPLDATTAPDVTEAALLPAPPFRISALGDRALVLEVDAPVNRAITLRMRALADWLRQLALPGVLDLVPAFCSLTVHYEPLHLRSGPETGPPYEALREQLARAIDQAPPALEDTAGSVEIPVLYGGVGGEDLEALAAAHGLSPDEVVDLHTAPVYFVGMLGFAPGFAYLAGLDPRLVTPRRSTPRARVLAGSVAIGGEHTGVYPFDSPGGWHVIGRTPLRLFDPGRSAPSLLCAGDEVRFVAIDEAQYRALAQEQAWR